MSLNDLIRKTAEAYAIDRTSAVQALVAIAGIVISVTASIAAFVSAWATARSLREMRAARLQQARPALNAPSNAQFTLIWKRGSNRFEVIGSSDTNDALSIPLKNVGFGAAKNVSFELAEKAHRPPGSIDYENLDRLFAAAELQVVRANYGVEIRDPFSPNIRATRLLTESMQSSFGVRYLEVDKVVDARIDSFFSEGFFAYALSMFDKPGHSWIWPATVRYQSLAGESYSDKYMIFITNGDCSFILGAPVGQRLGVPNWAQLHLKISISAMEPSQPISLRSVIRMYLSSRICVMVAPATLKSRLYYSRFRKALLERLTGARQFEIGDTVVFKPHADWQIDQEPGTFVTPDIDEIDNKRFRPAESSKPVG